MHGCRKGCHSVVFRSRASTSSRVMSNVMLYLYLLCFCILFADNSDGKAVQDGSYDHSAYLDVSEKFLLHWSVDRAKQEIHFAIVVNTTGWVGLGIAKGLAGRMKGADIVMGYVSADGKGHLQDSYALSEEQPNKDKNSDYNMVGSSEKDGQTTLRFSRKLQTCDEEDNPITDGTVKVIYAYHDKDPEEGKPFLYHSNNRGSRSLNLLNFGRNSPIPAHAVSLQMSAENVIIPARDTTYWCTSFKLERNDLGGKRHVIEIAPKIQKGNEGVVHHMILFICSFGAGEQFSRESAPCGSPNMPPHIKGCVRSTVFTGWAIGGNSFKMPDVAGFPIGEAQEEHFVLQTHYDNPQMKSGLIDSSGFTLYYTDKLRKYDAGTFTTGISVPSTLVIPPEKKEWTDHGYCRAGCMKFNKNTEEFGNKINVFSVMLHAHTAGSGIYSKIVRNGKEVMEIMRDDNYDFNYQSQHILVKEIQISQDDEFLTQCKFSTVGRKHATQGGQATKDEMCLTYLSYYPKQNITRCLSANPHEKEFADKYAPITGNTAFNNRNWSSVVWTEDMTEELKQALGKRNIGQTCMSYSSTGSMVITFSNTTTIVITDPLPTPASPCETASSGSRAVSLAWGSILFMILYHRLQ